MSKTKDKKKVKTKLALLLEERGYGVTQFAHVIFERTGEVMHISNLSVMISGTRPIGSVKTAKILAEALDVPIDAIV